MGCLNSVFRTLHGRKEYLKFAKNHGWFDGVDNLPCLC